MKTLDVVKRLLRDSRVIAVWLVLGALITILSIALSLLAPELLRRLTDSIYDYREEAVPIDWPVFVRGAGLLAAVYLLSAIAEMASVAIRNNFVTKYFTAGFRIRISDKIRRLPVSFLDGTPNGEIISRMNGDVSTMGNSIHNIFFIFISGFLRLAGITVIIFWLNPAMAGVIVIFVPASLALSAYLAGRSEKHFDAFRAANGKLYAFVEENLAGFDTVKAFHLESRQNGRHADLCDDAMEKAERGYYLNGLVQPVIAFVNNAVFILICILGGWFVLQGVFSVGTVLAFVLYAKQFSAPLTDIAYGLSMMQNTVASARRVYQLLEQEEVTECARKGVSDCRGEVEFKDVCFSYTPDRPLLRHLNLSVHAGQKVAIVGPTGGGKTTIVNLLMRFYDVDSGVITIDGQDISQMNRADLRDRFAMVLQDTWLFSGSIYENIAYGNPAATREEVYAAARMAHVDSFVETLPDGYDTVINEDAGNISGGQKQLLTIARAYLANRKMLILDEATSNVDTRTELLIQESMDGLMRGRTSFVIAHRLSTVVNADLILVVREGRIVEQGTHASLMAAGGFYAELYNSQYERIQ